MMEFGSCYRSARREKFFARNTALLVHPQPSSINSCGVLLQQRRHTRGGGGERPGGMPISLVVESTCAVACRSRLAASRRF